MQNQISQKKKNPQIKVTIKNLNLVKIANTKKYIYIYIYKLLDK
jgi:hypothetical protein